MFGLFKKMTPDSFSKIVLDEIAASDPGPKKLVFHFAFLDARRVKIDGLVRLVISVFAFLVTVRLNSAELIVPPTAHRFR
jgi:hypothetical protein